MTDEITEWCWSESFTPVKEQPDSVSSKKVMRIVVIETVNIEQEHPIVPPDSLVYLIGPYSKPLEDNQVYLHPPGIPSDMNLWDRQLTVSPESSEIGWKIELDYIQFHWLHTDKVEIRAPCWNEYANWFVSQENTEKPKYFLDSSDFLTTGITRGKKSKDIYYRAGATHSGRYVIFRKEGRHLELESIQEFPMFVKRINYPTIENWLEPAEVVFNKEKWLEWQNVSPHNLTTSKERLWELWEARGGTNLGSFIGNPVSINWTTSIKVSNLLGFGSPAHYWDWSNMTRTGYGMIVGTNTSGKSSWVDVWTFGFWGQTARTRPRGILRHGETDGWIEITWKSSNGLEGKLRRELRRFDASDSYRMKLFLQYRNEGEEHWKEYEGRHLKGLTDVKSPAKQTQLDLEEWVGTYDIIRETSLLGVDGTNEIWQRTSNEWNKIVSKLLWSGRQRESTQTNQPDEPDEDDKKMTHFKLGFPRTTYAKFMRDWMLNEGYIFLQTSTASFVSSPDDIANIISRGMYAFQCEMNELNRKKELEKEDQEEQDFRHVWEWTEIGLMRKWVQQLKDIWNERWGDGRISITYDTSKGVQFEWFPVGGKVGTELGMACRWERMMIMEGWRLLVYFMATQSGTPVMGDVWLDEEWDGVDDAHGLELMRTFGGWHGAHIVISHQEHWKRKMSYVLNMTPNYQKNRMLEV